MAALLGTYSSCVSFGVSRNLAVDCPSVKQYDLPSEFSIGFSFKAAWIGKALSDSNDTSAGADICHICFPVRSLVKRLKTSDDESATTVEWRTKPEGGSYCFAGIERSRAVL
jgi:hypothetical protein